MVVFTIAGLTLKEAIRRKTLLGALLLGLLILGISLLLILIRMRMHERLDSGRWNIQQFVDQYVGARSIITSLCIFAIRILGSLFAILLAGGSISGEIERGVLAVILPKPIRRWQILLGKWIGLHLILVGSTLLWTVLVWGSLTWQSGVTLKQMPSGYLTPILYSGLYLMLYPLVIGTLTLSLSAFSQRLLGTSLALTLATLSWFDGIFNFLADKFEVDILHVLADIAGLLVPQGYIAWWVEGTVENITFQNPSGFSLAHSSRFLQEWGASHLHFAHLDAVYVAFYIVALFIAGAVIFHKRDVA